MTDAIEAAMRWAGEIGFEHVALLDAATLETRHNVREACIRNLCGHYGRTWACPPACGELHTFQSRFRSYQRGVLVQTSLPVPRDAGLTEMLAVGTEHRRRLRAWARELPASAWILGGGECDACAHCSLPEPCRAPADQVLSMEAAGLDVDEVCRRNGLPVDHGDGTLTWVGCGLLE